MALLETLADNGMVNEAFELLTQTGCHGCGWQIVTGVTSLWEQQAYHGIMHSHSHAFFAGTDSAFYRVFCGVRPLEAGFKRFTVSPVLPDDMRYAACVLFDGELPIPKAKTLTLGSGAYCLRMVSEK